MKNTNLNRNTCILVEDHVWAIDTMEDYIGRRDDLVLLGSAIELSEVRDLLDKYTPDIIFLDLIIPPGTSSGFHFGQLPETSSIIVISAIPVSEYRGPLPQGELYELLKPFSFERFDKCVDEVLLKRERQENGGGN